MGRFLLAAVAALTLTACGSSTTTVVNNTTTVTAGATDSAVDATDSTAAVDDIWQDCGDIDQDRGDGASGIYNVEASQDLKCEYARNLTDVWLQSRDCGRNLRCSIGDYECVSRVPVGTDIEITCRGTVEGVQARFVLADHDPS